MAARALQVAELMQKALIEMVAMVRLSLIHTREVPRNSALFSSVVTVRRGASQQKITSPHLLLVDLHDIRTLLV